MRRALTNHLGSVRSIAAVMMMLITAGCDWRIGRPEALWLLWLIPLLIVFQIFVARAKTRALNRFAHPELVARIQSGVSRGRQNFKATLLLIATALLVLSLVEIKVGFSWEEVKRKGVDIVVALDVSDSMLVEDAEAEGKLSRLERAKRKVTDFLRLLEGDRVALVAFSGTAFVECPLTLDYGAAQIFLESIDTNLIPVKGTALDEAIRVSLKAFGGGTAKSQAIILITDGEDHSGEALAAAEEAKTQGIRIYTIGIGREEGAPIPDPGGGFRKDRRGEMVLSKLDETTLQKIALTTGGAYVHSVTGDVDLEKIYSQGIKATLEDQDLGSKRRQRWEERFQWIVAMATILLVVESFISERSRRRSAIAGLLLAGFVSLFAPAAVAQTIPQGSGKAVPVVPQRAPSPSNLSTAQSSDDPKQKVPVTYASPEKAYAEGAYDQALQGFTDDQVQNPNDLRVMLNVGSAHYKMGTYAEAEKAFAAVAAAQDPHLREAAFYNLGNTAYRQGQLTQAVGYYQAALNLDPNDEDAKFNLEFVRDEIRRRQEEAEKRAKEQQQQPQQQEQKNEQQNAEPQQQEKKQDQPQQQQAGNKDDKNQDQKQPASDAAQQAQPLSQEEAKRYLEALGEDRPVSPQQKAKGRSSGRHVDKDW